MEIKDKLIENDAFKDTLRKLCAQALFYSGHYKKIRSKNVLQGRPPYTIVRYPRIINPDETAYPILPFNYIEREVFRKHLFFYKEHCSVISFNDLLSYLRAGAQIASNTVVLTFDFGYQDFKKNALPLLKTFNLPACLFVPTGFIGSQGMLWQDRLFLGFELLKAQRLPFPKLLTLPTDASDILDIENGNIALSFQNAVLFFIYLKSLPIINRYGILLEFLEYIERQIGYPKCAHFLSWEDLQEIKKAGVDVQIAGHGFKVINELDDQELTTDITSAIQALKSHELQFNNCFAPPDEQAITPARRKLLKQLGIDYIFSFAATKDVYDSQEYGQLIKRIPITADINNFALLACRIWDIKPWGIRLA